MIKSGQKTEAEVRHIPVAADYDEKSLVWEMAFEETITLRKRKEQAELEASQKQSRRFAPDNHNHDEADRA